MERYVVSLTMDLNIEIDAESPEAAAEAFEKAFALTNPVDPLAETKINIGGAEAVIKTAIVQEWEVPEIDVQVA